MTSTNADFTASLDRLRAEGDTLENIVAKLTEEQWLTPTPAPGWSIAYQIAHLAWTDEAALAALSGDEGFAPYLRQAMANPTGLVDETAATGAQAPTDELLARWRTGREKLAAALEQADPQARYPWFGPPMKARSLTTARIMETWAHGQDVVDALGVTRPQSQALRDVAHLGVITRDFTYRNNGLEPPTTPLRVELSGPHGETWEWGPAQATDCVSGSALDFALLVTQRREPEQVNLSVTGSEAATWVAIAQAFAGPPTKADRAPHSR
ncbi:TIGR03084 family metal-binding protein [Gephyromycinifex aptenodytis]|uniref:TIGR03084 family metal-binding protein n=1 Tax=Gephyromycinifex aptenodytis TaxID=2716227 RepID=UPI001447FB0D|nr:TIGR03084 family metal-binding protein [Gephyromycinifex aptenodytis]